MERFVAMWDRTVSAGEDESEESGTATSVAKMR